MRLKVSLPTETIVDQPISRVSAMGGQGSFCLLPRHVDMVTVLMPGLLTFVTPDGAEHLLAVSGGILAKRGPEVSVSVRHAVQGPDLGALEDTIAERFSALDERERSLRTASAKLEADLVRRLLELRHHEQ